MSKKQTTVAPCRMDQIVTHSLFSVFNDLEKMQDLMCRLYAKATSDCNRRQWQEAREMIEREFEILSTLDLKEKEHEKKCTKCGIVKPLTEFLTRTTGRKGVFHECKECWRRRVEFGAKTTPKIQTRRYLKMLIKRQTSLNYDEIPPSLCEMKRQQIKAYRMARRLKNEENEL